MKQRSSKLVIDQYTTISAVWAVPNDFAPGKTDALILAHGAGHDMNHPFMTFIHRALAREGLLTVKFNFAYKEQGKKPPDSTAKLERTFQALLYAVRGDKKLKPGRLFLGGKSMGGRIASHLAAQGEKCDGLVFLGYPLHPPNQPKKLRTSHLSAIPCPMLFIEGTRDPFCQLSLLKKALNPLKVRTDMHLIEGGNHSFQVPKSLGRTQEDILQEVVRVVAQWIKSR